LRSSAGYSEFGTEAAWNPLCFIAQNVANYGGGDLFDIAAAYAFHIAEGQCFLDGNKRTAVAAALNFLANNGVKWRVDDDELYVFMIGIAEKRHTKTDLARYLREHSLRE
jgi:death-on-curing protein